jgi:hypothetical protein
MHKLYILKKELENLVLAEANYNEVLKKSQELDKYITEEMIKINRKELREKVEYFS